MGSHRVGHDWSDLAVAAGFPGGSGVKNLLGKLEMQVPSLDQEEPLEKEMATKMYSVCLIDHKQAVLVSLKFKINHV